MTKTELKRLGKEHARKGLKCTPYDCRFIDIKIFDFLKGKDDNIRMYATLRKAFNDGWQEEYYKITCEQQGEAVREKELAAQLAPPLTIGKWVSQLAGTMQNGGKIRKPRERTYQSGLI